MFSFFYLSIVFPLTLSFLILPSLFLISSFLYYSLLRPRSFFLPKFLISFSTLLISNTLQPFMSILLFIYLFIYSSRSISPYTITFFHLYSSNPPSLCLTLSLSCLFSISRISTSTSSHSSRQLLFLYNHSQRTTVTFSHVVTINVTQYTSAQSFFILKQGYMFRLNVSHLQALTTFSLPDALLTLGSHSVYNCGIHLVKTC